jgi:hypothetical protein
MNDAAEKRLAMPPGPLVWIAIFVMVVLVVAGLLLAKRRGDVLGGAERHLLRPAGKGPHAHLVDLDVAGFGVSTEDMGHRHVVENVIDVGLERDGVVAPADHVHDVTSYIIDMPA